MVTIVTLGLVLLTIAGSAASAQGLAFPAPSGTGSSAGVAFPTPIRHVMVVFMENAPRSAVESQGPFEVSLEQSYASATHYYAVCHPSTGNYLSATSGQPLHCGTDGYTPYSVNNIAQLVAGANLTWKGYAESMPKACDTTTSGVYAVRHNPLVYYSDLGSSCAANDLPFTSWNPNAAAQANYIWVTPNTLDDGHDTNVSYGDAWLKVFFQGGSYSGSDLTNWPGIENEPWFSSTVVFVTYDEGAVSYPSTSGYTVSGVTSSFCQSKGVGTLSVCGNNVYFSAVSPYTRGVGVYSADSSHYNLLGTAEWLLGLPCTSTGLDCNAGFPAMKGLFNFGTGGGTTQYSATFSEAGLPSGTSWSVSLGATSQSVTSSSISFLVSNGSYNYTVRSPIAIGNGTRYVATVPSGTLDVSGASVTTAVDYRSQFYLQTSASPAGGGTVTPSSGWYAGDASVSLRAVPSSGELFAGWSGQGDGSYNGSSNPTNVTVRGPVQESARFTSTANASTIVTFVESGLPHGTTWNVTFADETASSANSTLSFAAVNGTYTYTVLSPLPSSSPTTRFVDSASTGTVVVGNASVTIAVPFGTEFGLNVSTTPSGAGTVSPGGGWFAANATLTLSATPAAGYEFVAWNGSGLGSYSGPNASASARMGGPLAESARFVSTNLTTSVSVQVSGLPPGTNWSLSLGSGNWTTNVSEITVPSSQGSVGYSVESPIPVAPALQYVAQPSTGTLNVSSGSVNISVHFVPEALVTISWSGNGGVSVTPSNDGWHVLGTVVTFTALPTAGTSFAGWVGSGNGSYSGPANPVSLAVSGPVMEEAQFQSPGTSASGANNAGFGPAYLGPIIVLASVLGTVLAMHTMVRSARGTRSRRRK